MSKPLYTPGVMWEHHGRELGELPPHVYAIAEAAYAQIRNGGDKPSVNQSILVSGEPLLSPPALPPPLPPPLTCVLLESNGRRARSLLATAPSCRRQTPRAPATPNTCAIRVFGGGR